MRTIKGMVLCTFGIALGIVAVGCGDSIQGAAGLAETLGWMFAACAFLATAIVLCALGMNAENEREQEKRKINRVPHHTNEWRDAQ